MIDDSGQLAIDFLIGFTIFMVSLIIVLTFISGLFVGLQSRTIDYDAVAYRTGVILAEDPGEPNAFPGVVKLQRTDEWEFIGNTQKDMALRFGLTPYKSIPRILSPKKIESFGDASIYDLIPQDYRDRTIFGNYSYYITLTKLEGTLLGSVGEPAYPRNTGYIRRVVMVKNASEANIDLGNFIDPAPPASPNTQFSVIIDSTEMFDSEKSPVYWIDPMKEELRIRLSNIPMIPSPTLDSVSFSYWSRDSGGYIPPPQNSLTDYTTFAGGVVETVIPAGHFIEKVGESADREVNISINYDFNNVYIKENNKVVSYMHPTLVSPPATPELVPAILEVRIW